MNVKQKKARLLRLYNLKETVRERKVQEKRKQQEAFAMAFRRDWIQQMWDARREERRIKALNTPKTTSDECW
jgi:hypothetical protein